MPMYTTLNSKDLELGQKKGIRTKRHKKIKLYWIQLNLRGKHWGDIRVWFQWCFSSLKGIQEENHLWWERVKFTFAHIEILWNN